MKVLCDVCGVEGATLLCCADEAALCGACDGRVHSANKFAGKHRRLSLLHPSASSSSSSSSRHSRPLPLCDICKEQRGFVFCQEDRAILCRDCDVPIHTANIHASRHSRFLLTGILLSDTPVSSPSSSSCPQRPPEETAAFSGGGSSITDYLTKMLPGWRVEDFLFDDDGAAAAEAGRGGDCFACEALPAVEGELGDLLSGYWIAPDGDNLPIWLPPSSGVINTDAVTVAAAPHEPPPALPVQNLMEESRHGWTGASVFVVPQLEYERRCTRVEGIRTSL
ncbi:putative salt tolerance-like protein [Apostasia shenzhenica]|uniref:Putative salt tolerance-like protein n=1 Tax=Apostasia shenzhenica TaxID=1088818 RepID=A0A2H9ZT78_9ASPA|nr:putative salt tolerance-like protein [Apostasia shenzhenica]